MSHAPDYAQLMTVEEFLCWPGDRINRLHALIDGIPVAMNPTTLAHSMILGELFAHLRAHLLIHHPNCRAFIEPAARPRAGSSTNLRIPDLGVACGPPGTALLDNPIAIAEILPPSNARETREAVRACLGIATLREVLVVDSTRMRAESMVRAPDGLWPTEPTLIGPDDDIVLESLDFRVPLAALYEGTGLSAG